VKLQVLEQPWYADGLTFTCTQCGNCCTGGPGFVWISDAEIDRLAEHLKLPRKTVLEKYCRKIGNKISLKEFRSPAGLYDCVFLKEIRVETKDKSKVKQTRRICEIYPVRPLQCRTFPFWDGILKSEQTWKEAGKRCPGLDRGSRKFSREQIEKLRDATDWPQNPPSSSPSSSSAARPRKK
jgi:Fe-S-cluster containining protein